MYNLPYSYESINVATGQQRPSTVHCRNAALTNYFTRYLLQKAISVFKFKLPITWSRNYFLYVLYCFGYIAIINTDKYGVIPQHCTLGGFNVFYQPTNALISNPLLAGNLNPRIGSECELMKLQPDYGGIMDIVQYYADLLAICAESAGINIVNSRLAYVFTANGKTVAESFKKMFDSIASGDPAVVIDKNLIGEDGRPSWDTFAQNLQQNYIAGDVLSDMRKIEAMFDTDIGIPNANTDKRERLVTDEVNANNIETISKTSLWLEQLQESCQKVNKMFGLDLSVDWRFQPVYNNQEGGGENGNRRMDVSTGTV